jgi:glucans biosynthesis protein
MSVSGWQKVSMSGPAVAFAEREQARAWMAWLWLLLGLLLASRNAHAFGFEDVAEQARKLAASAYQPATDKLPRELRDMEYDEYRDIRFKPDAALWREAKLPFEVMFFAAGRSFTPVRVNEVVAQRARPVPFDPALFDFGRNKIEPRLRDELGFAGFRVHYAMNRPDYKDEVVVFLGASYFRAVGKGQVYGLSARGLAVDTAAPQGEEFPRFSEYWIERPQPNATTLTIYALLDSPRLSGAYQFLLRPGAETVMTVHASLYARSEIGKLGIAPLTSMYDFGENQPGHDDYRPEVHDSDGLSVQSGEGEWLWRPLVNPKRLLVTSFATVDPRGFGLMQRDRAFTSYEDTEARYERRPSVWVEPLGAWGPGRVELVQIPTPDETNDNIVAYWVPKQALTPQHPISVAYRMRWQMGTDTRGPLALVTQTRRGRGYVKQPDGQLKFVVDFEGGPLKGLAADAAVDAVVTVGAGAELAERNLFRNNVTGGWRMTVRLKRPDASKPLELRAFLKTPQRTVSETWSYIVPAEGDKP